MMVAHPRWPIVAYSSNGSSSSRSRSSNRCQHAPQPVCSMLRSLLVQQTLTEWTAPPGAAAERRRTIDVTRQAAHCRHGIELPPGPEHRQSSGRPPACVVCRGDDDDDDEPNNCRPSAPLSRQPCQTQTTHQTTCKPRWPVVARQGSATTNSFFFLLR